MRVAVACYAALVLRSAALRYGIGRLESLELEVAEEEILQEVLESKTHPQAEALEEVADPDPSIVSTAKCIDGTLHLQGQNVANRGLVFSKECATLRGDMGAQVILKQPLIFEGDVRMEGDIRFIAASSFWQPCVSVKGSVSMFGNIHFESCHNKDTNWTAGGGGLMVGKTLTQHAGAMSFHNCSSEGHGGGLYVAESLAQNNGTMAFNGCSSNSIGCIGLDEIDSVCAKLFFILWTVPHLVVGLLYFCCPEWLYQPWEPWPPVMAEQCYRFRITYYCSDKAENRERVNKKEIIPCGTWRGLGIVCHRFPGTPTLTN